MIEEYDIAWDVNATNALNRIYHFTADAQSESKARKLKKELVSLGNTLRTLPKRNPKEPLLEHLSEEFRFVVKGYYKLIYYVDIDSVIVVDIFDTRQDPRKLIEAFEK